MAQRDTTRQEERAVAKDVQNQGQKDRKEIRRNSDRIEKGQKELRGDVRREAKKEEAKIDDLKQKQKDAELSNLIRREKGREVDANNKVKNLIRRQDERKRFAHERKVERANEQKISKKLRRDEKSKFEDSEFKSLRNLERRDFGDFGCGSGMSFFGTCSELTVVLFGLPSLGAICVTCLCCGPPVLFLLPSLNPVGHRQDAEGGSVQVSRKHRTSPG